MRRAPAPLSAVFLLAAGLALGTEREPRLEIGPEGAVLLVSPPAILADDAIRDQLTSGLTTGFHFRLAGRDDGGRKLEGGARVDVRYELWDEVFELTVFDYAGRPRRERAGSYAELETRWRSLRLAVLDAGRRPRGRTRLVVEVVPFSQRELDDAQRWFSETAEKGGTDEVERAGERRSDTLSRTMTLLLATSIERRPMASYRYALEPPGAVP